MAYARIEIRYGLDFVRRGIVTQYWIHFLEIAHSLSHKRQYRAEEAHAVAVDLDFLSHKRQYRAEEAHAVAVDVGLPVAVEDRDSRVLRDQRERKINTSRRNRYPYPHIPYVSKYLTFKGYDSKLIFK
jgi:hypothetical protein